MSLRRWFTMNSRLPNNSIGPRHYGRFMGIRQESRMLPSSPQNFNTVSIEVADAGPTGKIESDCSIEQETRNKKQETPVSLKSRMCLDWSPAEAPL